MGGNSNSIQSDPYVECFALLLLFRVSGLESKDFYCRMMTSGWGRGPWQKT